MTTLSENQVDLAAYAEQAYLSYAMSVVMGRALPLVQDGQKPVQRRILYAMHRMGLHEKAKHTKSARITGETMGKYHPHGDASVYDAAVRMSQDFSLRYPLVDGQGNFGSRDGDGAAAARYTEARLTRFAELLLGELDQGTVAFAPNYDGTLKEPEVLPARLPVLLLNGASGIAVGMATEIPSHNLDEVAKACLHLIRNPASELADILQHLPGPDFPCGGQIISSAEEIQKAYATGRGAFRTRAQWVVEPLARGQWQIAITALPPDTSTAKVLLEIEALTNPPIKAGKKALTQDQLNLKNLMLSLVDRVADDSDGDHPVRLVVEPKSSRQDPEELMRVLLAHTSLEANVSLNLVTIGADGKPQQKGLLQVLQEWIEFRFETVSRRIRHRLAQVEARRHVLAGRLVVFANLDEVIRIVREAEAPRQALMSRYGISEIQADDILELRLRQLMGLEKLKLESEDAALAAESAELKGLLDCRDKLTDLVCAEVDADRVKYGDARRTLIQPAARITTTATPVASSDPVTLIVSRQGWLRARAGHKADLSALTWKPGDEALAILEARSDQTVALMDSTGRVYNVTAAVFPLGRGDGVPVTTLVDLSGASLAHAFVLPEVGHFFLANTGGYGFICQATDLSTRQKAGKAVMTLDSGERPLAPVQLPALPPAGAVALAATNGKVLLCTLEEIKQMPKGKGVQLMSLNKGQALSACQAYPGALQTLSLRTDTGETLTLTDLAPFTGKRARAGGVTPHKGAIVALEGAWEALPDQVATAEAPGEVPQVAEAAQTEPQVESVVCDRFAEEDGI